MCRVGMKSPVVRFRPWAMVLFLRKPRIRPMSAPLNRFAIGGNFHVYLNYLDSNVYVTLTLGLINNPT